jgi:hypothetical protein
MAKLVANPLSSGVVRLWQTVSARWVQIAKGCKIVQKSYFYPTIKPKFFRYAF